MGRPFLILFSYAYILLAASTAAAQPGWVTKPPAGNSLYLYGVGIAHGSGDGAYDRRRADDVARTDIARQLRVTISSRLTSTKKEDADAGFSVDTEETVESSVTLTLDGVTIRERHYDKKHGTYYSLARLNRQTAADVVAGKIRSAADRAGAYLRRARLFREDGASYRALMSLLRAVEERGAVALDESIHKALASSSVDALLEAEGLETRFSPSLVEIEREINTTVSSLVFSDETGTEQTIDVGRVELPLSGRLLLKSGGEVRPATGYPIIFSVKAGHATLDERDTVDKVGSFETQIRGASTCVDPLCEVVASIDTSAIRNQAPGQVSGVWLARLGDLRTSYELMPGILGLEDGIGELGCRLLHAPRLMERFPDPAVAVSRFTYQDTRISGPFSGPLRRLLQSTLTQQGDGRILDQVELSAGTAQYGDPNRAETLARSIQADVVVWGDYWETGDSVVVNARMTARDGARIASSSVAIPKGAIPYTVRPPVLDPNIPDPPANGIFMEVWTERGDGGLFVEGERLTTYLKAESDGYVRLLYRQVDGSVIQIFPNRLGGDERVTAGEVYSMPDVDDTFDFIVQAPFGVEHLIAIAGSTPFPQLPGRNIKGGILLQGTVKDVVQRLTGGRTWYGQAVCTLTTVAQ